MSGSSGGQSPLGRLVGAVTPAAVIGLCLLLALASVPVGQATHEDDPNFSVYVQTPIIEPGGTTEVTVLLENDGSTSVDNAITAEDVRVSMDAGDTPIEVLSGVQAVDSMADGQLREFTFRVRVPRDIPAGEYTLPVDIDYEYTEHANRKTDDQTVKPTFRVEERARFAIVESVSDVSVGDTGTINVTVENRGEAAAVDGTMTLTSQSAAVTVGGAEADSRYLGRVSPGERRTLSYEVSIAESADPQSFSLSAVVDYEDTDGLSRSSPTMGVQLTPSPEQEFELRGLSYDLRVGEDGTVSGEVVNHGPNTARNAVAVLSTDNPNLDIPEADYVLGTLQPGESASFEYDVSASEEASEGPRQLTMEVRYRNAAGTQLSSKTIDVPVEVAAERDVLDVQATSSTVEAGSSGRLVLEVTNVDDEPISDVSAKLFANDPLSSSNDEAFQSEIAPGETEEFVFEISGAAGALPKTYPASVDFQYDDADGDTLLSDTYRVPVEVVEPESSGGPPVLPIVGVLVVVLGGGYYLLRRRGRWPPWR